MRVLILWANKNHDNLGVAALGRGMEKLAKQAFGEKTEVYFHGTGDSSLPHNDGPINISRVKLLLKSALTPKSEFNKWLKSFDLIIDARGGDSFSDIYGVKRQIKTSTLSWLAPFWGVPVVMGPQTIGPFNTVIGKSAAWLTLKTAKQVFSRDPISVEYANKLGHYPEVLTTDVVFALEHEKLEKEYDVLLNVSGLLWDKNPHVNYEKYRLSIMDIIENLHKNGRDITLFPHVLSDSPQSRLDHDIYPIAELIEKYPYLKVATPKDLLDARKIAGKARVVIAARMHACLNALSMSTPAIPMAYSRKFEPLLSQINWSHTVDIRTENNVAQRVLQLVSKTEHLAEEARDVRSYADSLISKAVHSLQKIGHQ
ncbi:polysaccharide pyruvyl transferase family protein [Rothia sp. P7181]|uniref:polysaccharide pyruvyl transferase family protein n=1 Tax=Rothia sp. P7181 TaxID=3402663 RepID=UPI003AD97A5D